MKLLVLLSLVTVEFLSTPCFADIERIVSDYHDLPYEDTHSEGTLRRILFIACKVDGDDLITFVRPPATGEGVQVLNPLVIPENCRGRITLRGRDTENTILESAPLPGGSVEGDSCILNIYSNNNTIENLTFEGNSTGAGICVFGRNNHISQNRFMENRDRDLAPDRYGIVISNYFAPDHAGMDGTDNQIMHNTIQSTLLHGIFIQAHSNTVENNTIQESAEMGIVQLGDDARIRMNQMTHVGRIGVFVQGNNILVEQNQIRASGENGIQSLSTHSHIQYNHIDGSLQDGINHKGDIETYILSNEINDAHWSGIAFDGSVITVKDNGIHHSLGNGVSGHGSRSFLQENQIDHSHKNGIDYFGQNTEIHSNLITDSYNNGLVLRGQDLTVDDNNILSNAWSGIWVEGTQSRIFNNHILANGGCPQGQHLATQKVECFSGNGSGGPGILVNRGTQGLVIGGDFFETDRNIIQYNRDGGIILLGDVSTKDNRISHNTISRNYGPEPDLDLNGDGLTLNDPGDADEGPEHLLNYADYIQSFPLIPSLGGQARYWTWGLAKSGNQVELYGVPDDDRGRGRIHGGGEIFYGSSVVSHQSFRIGPDDHFQSFEDQQVTTLTFDERDNTSEFSLNVLAGSDHDLDGIVDSLEMGDGTPGSHGSSSTLTDSDGDGLPDSVEDANRNGRWDPELGETSAYNSDTDGDGLSDWTETHGDGHYDIGIDTDPLNPDTDLDGLRDGDEDRNGNGVWDTDETSPLIPDSDGDGIIDSRDNCPGIPNPGQEPWFCGART